MSKRIDIDICGPRDSTDHICILFHNIHSYNRNQMSTTLRFMYPIKNIQ